MNLLPLLAAFHERSNAVQRLCGLLFVVVIAVSQSSARADGDDAGGPTNRVKRPIEDLFKTDVVFPEENGELEVELASIYQNHSGGDTWTIPLSLEYGLNDNWQVEAQWDALVQHFPSHRSAVRGVGDFEVGSQYSFMNLGGSLYHIAPRFAVQVPVGDVNNGLSEGFLQYEPAVIFARDFPQFHRTQVFTEIGASLLQRVNTPKAAADTAPAAHELDWGSGFFVLFAHAAATLEFNVANDTWNHHGVQNEMYLTPGFLWKARRNMEIGLGLPIGLNQSSDRFDVVAHLVWEF